jgi:hypothetical protein
MRPPRSEDACTPSSRNRSETLRIASAACLVAVLVSWAPCHAQRGVAREGALFLLLPVGARTVGAGQSVATPEPGSEQLFWNPAAIARATQREAAFHYASFFVGPLNVGSFVLPLGRAGVVGATVSVLDYGQQETTGGAGNLSTQAYVFAATYAAGMGSRLNLGFTFKNARFIGSCSGLCPPLTVFDVSTSAVDVGVQYRVAHDDDLIVAGALRNAGLRFQLNDDAQADPLPTRIQFGASYRLRQLDSDLSSTVIRVSADVIDRASAPGAAALRVGVAASWQQQLSVRAAYVQGSGEGTGFAAGIGFSLGRASLDVARTLGSESSSGSSGSTFLSLRGRW